jgi:beta-lactamase regulating signal transducer with metallopeptidase domain
MPNLLETHLLPGLLRASWQAGILILLVLAIQRIFGRRLNPAWRYSLWLIVAIRLALPVTVSTKISLFNWVNPGRLLRDTPEWVTASLNPPAPTAAVVSQASSASAATPEPGFWKNFAPETRWLLGIWAGGAALLGGYVVLTHYRLWRRVQARRPLIDASVMNLLEDIKQEMGVRVPVTLVESEEVGSPSLFGFIRPRLLLPAGLAQGFSREELRHVLLHELGHIKRQDILLGWLMATLQILHWFNPLVWVAFHRMRVDRELACDALALSYALPEGSQPYGRTIIKLLEGFGRSAWAPSLAGTVENKKQMKERITMIATFHKSKAGLPLAAAVASVLGLMTLTDAEAGAKAGKIDPQAPPQIVATSPKLGESEVNPNLKKITVTFDRDMEAGFSWTGGGPEYPPSREGEQVVWRNKRTCELPVSLEAGHFYRVGINSKSYRNFKSVAGAAAFPTAIYFTTRGASEELKARLQAPKAVSFEPANGAAEVSASCAEVRVTFNVPMGKGCSWCLYGQDDSDFPKGREGQGVSWTEDGKTCVMPVTLQPGKTYRVMLNRAGYNGFESDGGVQLEPTPYIFTTAK